MHKRAKKRIGMEDIAQLAGVSKSAVSKALNNKSDTSPELKQKIFSICEEYGYQVNFRIQDLIRKGKNGITQNIALVIVGKEFSDPAYARAIDGIIKGARDHHLNLMLENLSGDEQRLYDLPPVLRDGRIDGVLITGSLKEQVLTLLSRLELPYVILGNYPQLLTSDFPRVTIDLEQIVRQVIAILKNRGKERIAVFSENYSNPFETRVLQFHKDALSENELPFDEGLIYEGPGFYAGAYDSMKPIFRGGKLPFDSILCFDFRSAQEISHLVLAYYGLDATPQVTIVTGRPSVHLKLPVPAVYVDNIFDTLAYEGVNILMNYLKGESSVRSKKIILDTPISESG